MSLDDIIEKFTFSLSSKEELIEFLKQKSDAGINLAKQRNDFEYIIYKINIFEKFNNMVINCRSIFL